VNWQISGKTGVILAYPGLYFRILRHFFSATARNSFAIFTKQDVRMSHTPPRTYKKIYRSIKKFHAHVCMHHPDILIYT